MTYFENKIRNQAYNTAFGYRFLMNNGAIKRLPRGTLKDVYHKYEEMDAGEIGIGYQDLPENVIKATKTTTKLCNIGTKLVYTQRELDAFMNAQHASGNMPQVGISLILRRLFKQANQFIYNGDNLKDPLDNANDMAGAGEFQGLTDLGTDFDGGDGDDDVTEAGDFFAGYANAKKALYSSGIMPPYTIIWDADVDEAATSGNQLYTNAIPTTEKRQLLEEYNIADIIVDVDLENADGHHEYIVTNPLINIDPMSGEKELAYRMVTTDFQVFPQYGGGLNGDNMYETIVGIALAIQVFDSNAIQISGDLTLST